MSEQTYFFKLEVLESFQYGESPPQKKRERPQRWQNFYSVYAYDFTAYHDFCKALSVIEADVNSYASMPLSLYASKILIIYALILKHARQVGEQEFRKWFFVLDKSGDKQPDSDEKHIYRTATLHKIYEKIYDFCNINPFDKFNSIRCNGLTIWFDDRQAEISGTERLSIKNRLKLHIKLLRLLKGGCSVKVAAAIVKKDIM